MGGMMPKRKDSVPATAVCVEEMIVTVRGERVILDHDLARLYGVTTKALNQAVKRNPGRFPADFVFRLTFQELTDLRSQSVTSSARRNRSQFVTGSEKHRNPWFLPYAFTEHGALMAANVLRSPRAVDMSVFVVRVFVRLRRSLAGHAELSRRLDEMENKYDAQFKVVFDAIRQLMALPEKARRSIGFRVEEAGPAYRMRQRGRRIK
jgi:hypothetical protein